MVDKKITELTDYTPPIDADVVPIVDTTLTITKKITWANIKAALKTYFDSLATTLTNKTLTSPVINTPTGIVKGDVGLGNVDNTSDATKDAATATLENKTLTTPVIASVYQDAGKTKLLTVPDTASDTLAAIAATQTFTNKRKKPRPYTTTSLATLTPEIDTYDMFSLTAQAEALNIANHSTSTPTAGECILINITPDATPRALTYGTNYVAYSGVALPSTTVASKRMQMLFIWLPVGKYTLAWVGDEA